MERDPVRFVWRQAPAANLLIVAVAVLVALPGIWILCEVLRSAIDDVLLGRAYAGGRTTAPFLPIGLTLPERIREEPLQLFAGFSLSRHDLARASVAALAFAAVLLAFGVLALGFLRLQAAKSATLALQNRLVEAIAAATPTAFDVARHAAGLAGEAMAGEARTLGRLIALPAVAGVALAAAFLAVLATDWRMALVAALGLALFVAAAGLRRRVEARFGQARLLAAKAVRSRLEDLARRLPALSAHGTAALERARFHEEAAPAWAPVADLDRATVTADAVTAVAALVAPVGVLAVGLWSERLGQSSPGTVLAAATAASLCVAALAALLFWRRDVERLRPVFDEIAHALGTLNARRSGRAAPTLPSAGLLVAEQMSAVEAGHGTRLADIDLELRLPAHIAITGDHGSGAHLLAAVMAGQVPPSAGRMRFDDIEIVDAEPSDRALRLAYAGGEPYLIPGSLRANLLYGCPESEDCGRRLHEAIAVAGFDAFVQERGLSARIDPEEHPELAASVVEARQAIRAALSAPDLVMLIEPFEPDSYNSQASIGENILFGVPLGDTFREDNLPSQPFMRGLLEREDLSRPLADLGAAVARATLELFGDVDGSSPILERFAPASGAERRALEQILERRELGRRSSLGARDSERLIGLALRYSESRHRLGLLGPDLIARLIKARHAFAGAIPDSLRPAIEFFDAERLCAAASLRDNLLFGRVVQSQAGAQDLVFRLLRAALDEFGLGPEVIRLGLDARLNPAEIGRPQAALIDLARCLVRGPDNLVVEHALAALMPGEARALITRLRQAMQGRGLIVVLPDSLDPAHLAPFDGVIRCEEASARLVRGTVDGNARPSQMAPASTAEGATAHMGRPPAAIG